jgi:hypothetical protein
MEGNAALRLEGARRQNNEDDEREEHEDEHWDEGNDKYQDQILFREDEEFNIFTQNEQLRRM